MIKSIKDILSNLSKLLEIINRTLRKTKSGQDLYIEK